MWSRCPKEDERSEGAADGSRDAASRQLPARADRERRARRRPAFSLTDAKRIVLPNGLTLILLEDHRLPIVVARADVTRRAAARAGREIRRRRRSSATCSKRAPPSTPAKQIAALIEDTGGSLEFALQRRVAQGAHARTPTSGSDLLFECLTHADLPDRTRSSGSEEQQLSAIADAETQPRNRARQRFRRGGLRRPPVRPAGTRHEGDRREADRRRREGVPRSGVRPELRAPSWSSATSRRTRW